MTCGEARVELGAYVVGALDPPDRVALEAHLDACPACRDELAELAGLPGLLGHLDPAEVEAGPARPSAAMLDRLLAEVAAETATRRTRTRRQRWLAVAACLAVLAGGGAAAATLASRGGGPPPAAAVSAVDARTHVRATVWLHPKPWGTAVTLQLAGVPAEERCSLVAIGRDGHREYAGSWQASYQGTARLTGAVGMQADQVARFDVVTFAGQRLVSLPVAGGGNGERTGGATTG